MNFKEFYLKENQIDTPEFKKWFGNSKVVDEIGKPLVVYKGMLTKDWKTGDIINVINSPNGQWAGFFSSNEDVATRFKKAFSSMGEADVKRVYLKIEKPFIVDAKGQQAKTVSFDDNVFGKDPKNIGAFTAFNMGYDGVIIKNTSDEDDIYIPKNSNQIKSATGNNGTFDSNSDNINEEEE